MTQIFYDIDTMRRVNADGAPITVLPAFYYNTAPVVQFQFLNNGTPIDLSGIAGWRAAIDTDFNSSSDPAVRVTADGIDASQSASGILSVTFDCRSAEFLSKLNNNRAVTGWLDIYGIDGSGISAFIAQMQVQLFSVVDPEQGTPPVIPDLYPSAAAVEAMISGHNISGDAHENRFSDYTNTTGMNTAIASAVSTHNNAVDAHSDQFGRYTDTEGMQDAISAAMPAGTVIAFAGSAAPEGFIACNGALIDRTTYADLFAAIGTTYGEGDGSTTFALPDLTDRFIQGSTTVGTVLAAGLPNITGTTLYGTGKADLVTGAFSRSGYILEGKTYTTSELSTDIISSSTFNASNSNSIYGASNTVQPPALTMLYCIKY